MIETEKYSECISEIQRHHMENNHSDISCYEAIAIWLSGWVEDQADQETDQRRGN